MSEKTSLFCFLCSLLAKVYNNSENTSSCSHALSINLDIIYLLTNLLQVPKEDLESQLKESGTNPDSWINLCEKCTHLTKNARELDQQIKKIERELKSIKKQVVETIKNSDSFSNLTENVHQEEYCYHTEYCTDFAEKMKCFIKTYNYDNLDLAPVNRQYLEGDNLAKYLESHANNSTTLLLFDESDAPEEIKVEVDFDLSPISSPLPSPKDSIDAEPQKEEKIRHTKNGKTLTCEVCGKELGSPFSLYRHRRFVHKIGKVNVTPRIPSNWDGDLVCSICQKEFSNKKIIQRHMKYVHQKEFSLSCHLCGMGIQSKHQLKIHLLGKHKNDPVAKQLEEEEGIKNLKCPVVGCASRFIKIESLDKHVDKFHGGDKKGLAEIDKRFKCQFCGKGFWDKTKLKHHERIHEGEGKADWKCEICGKGFGTKQYLRYHQLHTHKQAKKFTQS